MQPTLEIRWFFPHIPCAPDALFETLPAAEARTDWYAFPCHPHCGIKIRDGKLEVKLLLQDLDAGKQGNAQEDMQRWGKWSSTLDNDSAPSHPLLQANGWVAVRKQRFQQVFTLADDQIRPAADDYRNNYCQLEWTELAVASEQWWTIAVEA